MHLSTCVLGIHNIHICMYVMRLSAQAGSKVKGNAANSPANPIVLRRVCQLQLKLGVSIGNSFSLPRSQVSLFYVGHGWSPHVR